MGCKCAANYWPFKQILCQITKSQPLESKYYGHPVNALSMHIVEGIDVLSDWKVIN